MNTVEPIRDLDLLQDVGRYFDATSPRNKIMFLLGIYSGLRISDILKLKVKDVKNRSTITIRETKTGKQKIFAVNQYLKEALNNYIESYDLDMDTYLIKRQGKHNKPISRDMAYKIMREAANFFGIQNVGTHTMRKTFGYHFYQQTKDVVTLQKIFNHSDPSITLNYIGLQQAEINKKINDFKLF